jgi:hypothetical protein
LGVRSQRSIEERLRELAEWRASGETAAAFAARRGYAKSTLMTWAARAAGVPRTAAVESEEPCFVRLEVASAVRTSVVIEVGAARVVVERGFDAELLRRVVGALSATVAT